MWLFGRDPVRDFGFEMGAAEPDPEPNGVWKRLRGHRKVRGGGGASHVRVRIARPHFSCHRSASRIAASAMLYFMAHVVCPTSP